MNKAAVFCAIVAVILISGMPSYSDTIYSTFGPGQTYQSGGWLIGSYPNNDTKQVIAAPFTPASNATLYSIDFAAVYMGGPNQLTVQLASDDGGVPGLIIESFNFTNISNISAVYTAFSATNPLLIQSTQYWVIMTTSDLVNSYLGWNLNDQDIMGFALSNSAHPGWQNIIGLLTPAFDVIATPSAVPEPTSLILLGIGLGMIGITARRGRK